MGEAYCMGSSMCSLLMQSPWSIVIIVIVTKIILTIEEEKNK